MRILRFSSFALLASITALPLAACGGSHGIDNFVATLQAVGAAQRASHVGRDLLYVVMGESNTHVLSYPGYKQLFKVPMWGFSTSNPNNGEVLIGGVGGSVKLYEHGSKNPIAEFVAPYPDETIRDSAFDPTTSDIALTIDTVGSRKSYVAVYQTPSGVPSIYTASNLYNANFLGYDNQGNLFVDGSSASGQGALAELPKGGSSMVNIMLSQELTKMGSLQWDGGYITVVNGASICRLQISGSEARVVGQTKLDGAYGKWGDFWIQGDTVIAPHFSAPHNGRHVGFWHYPAGGKAYKIITNVSKERDDGMVSATISSASTY